MEHNATYLRQLLTERFSDDELKTLCFDLGLEYDLLPGEGKGGKARELLRYLDRRDRMGELIEIGQKMRSDIPWMGEADELPKLAIPHNLPPRSEFVGREAEKTRVYEALASRYPLVSIDGIGGIGKTSLALEVAYECLQASREAMTFDGKTTFAGFIWASAKDRDLTLNDLLNTIARTLDYTGIAHQPEGEKREAVERLLRGAPYLLLVDNLETVGDENVRDFLLKLPEPSKALITTREQTLRQVWAISLKGLAQDTALELIRSSGHRLGLQAITQAQDSALLRLYEATGGAPLAIKWAVGQIKQQGQSLDSVLAVLYEARGDIFEEVFARSWALLSSDAQRVLKALPLFAAPASSAALAATSDIHHFVLKEAIGQLVEMSLVEVTDGLEEEERRYDLHPLARAFANARLIDNPEFERQARERMAEYYVKIHKGKSIWGEVEENQWFEVELPNIIAIIEWANLTQRWEIVISLYESTHIFLGIRGYWQERLQYGQMALEAAMQRRDRASQASIQHSIGWVAFKQGRLVDANKLLQSSIQAFIDVEQKTEEGKPIVRAPRAAWAMIALAKVAIAQGDLDQANRVIDEAKEMVEDDARTIFNHSLSAVKGRIEFERGDYKQARVLLNRALNETREAGVDFGIGSRLIDLGDIALAQNRLDEAESLFSQGFISSKEVSRNDNIARAELGLVKVYALRGETAKAKERAVSTREKFVRMGMESSVEEVDILLESLREQ
jgi:tetratricopeptide (TPR) repeat protein